MIKRFFTLLLIVFTISPALFAQGTIADYNRAFALKAKLKNKVFYSNVVPEWIGNTSKFWYIRHTPDGNIYVVVDAVKKNRVPLFDSEKLATALTDSTGKKIDYKNLTLGQLRVNKTVDTLHFAYNNKIWTYAIKSNQLVDSRKEKHRTRQYWGTVDTEKKGKPQVSPDKKYTVFIRDNNVILKNNSNNTEKALTTDGTDSVYYSVYLSWSPDSKKIAVMKIHAVPIRQLTLINSAPSDQLQPEVVKRDYPKPGDKLMQKVPVIFNIETGKTIVPSNELFPNQFSLWGFNWDKESKTVLFEYNQRGHQVYRVLELSAETGKVRTIINETSDTFVNYNRYYKKLLSNGKEIIWMSERDNWNHLYLYNRQTGKVENQITKGHWYVRHVVYVNEKKRQIIFSANGMVPHEDPYLVRYYRINFDGTGLKCLTPEEGMHKAWFSADKKYFVDVYSMVNKAPIAVLRDTKTGKIILHLETADITQLLKTGWIAPEPFVAKGRDGKTDIWGIIYRPTNFDPHKKYPVIEYIYAGPGDQYVPKTFIPYNWTLSDIAELGFVMIQVDGMGTSYRSKAFESIIYKNLKDAGFADRIAWTRAAAKKYAFMDTTRLGIYGASAGGQEAMWAVLFHPEHYKAAYSASGCHDNRMDKIWWNEQWMGYPVDSSYAACSNVVNAHLLTRPLMLVVGNMDDNVDPSSTYQVVNALEKANKNFDLVVLPESNHTMGGDYGQHKRFDFFVKHLMHKDPPAWSDVKSK